MELLYLEELALKLLDDVKVLLLLGPAIGDVLLRLSETVLGCLELFLQGGVLQFELLPLHIDALVHLLDLVEILLKELSLLFELDLLTGTHRGLKRFELLPRLTVFLSEA